MMSGTNQPFINNDEISHYLKDVRKIPVISLKRQDEICLLLNDENTSKKDRAKLLNELVTGNLRIVIKIARAYQNRGVDLPDLINEGNLGLIKATEKFNPTSNVRFYIYAMYWVRLYINNSINNHGSTIRIPTKVNQEAYKNSIKFDTKELVVDNGGNSLITLPYTVRLHGKLDDEHELIDIIENKNTVAPDEFMDGNDDLKTQLNKMLSILSPRERIIIEGLYGLNGQEFDMEDLAIRFNCTKERVRQLKEKSIKKLRNESHLLFNI